MVVVSCWPSASRPRAAEDDRSVHVAAIAPGDPQRFDLVLAQDAAQRGVHVGRHAGQASAYVHRRAFFDRLRVPLFNAVGNHDLSGTVYQEACGPTLTSFTLGTAAFVLLDTERDNYMSALQAKEYGLIDEVIAHR